MRLWTFLVVLQLWWTCGWGVAAAQEPTTQNDWSALWPTANRSTWEERSEKTLLNLAHLESAPAKYVLWKKWRLTHPVEASNFLASAAQDGFPQALLELGETDFQDYSKPFSVRTNGWHQMVRAATSGYPPAAELVARYDSGFIEMGFPTANDRWRGGRFPPLDLARSLRLLRTAVDEGYGGALVPLALLYSSGIGEPRTTDESPQNLLLNAARAGKPEAYRNLADRYLKGHGVERDRLEAARWSYFGYRAMSMARDLVDLDGKAKVQSTPELQDLADLLALFIAVADRNEPTAAAELGEQYYSAGKFESAAVLFKLSTEWGGKQTERLRAARSTLSKEQLQRVAQTTSFPPPP